MTLSRNGIAKNSSSTVWNVKTLGVVLGVSFSLAACSNAKQVRGYLFDPELADEIMPGVDNMASVQATLGSPTLPALFDDNVWYYVSSNVRTRPVFWPDPRWQRVMAVTFADSGAVQSVVNYDLSNARFVEPNGDKTKTRGRNLNLFQQLFSNIGAVGQGGPAGGGRGGNRGPGPNG